MPGEFPGDAEGRLMRVRLAAVVPLRPVLAPELVTAEPGVVVLDMGADAPPLRIPAARALVLAHALETTALAALAMAADRKRGRR